MKISCIRRNTFPVTLTPYTCFLKYIFIFSQFSSFPRVSLSLLFLWNSLFGSSASTTNVCEFSFGEFFVHLIRHYSCHWQKKKLLGRKKKGNENVLFICFTAVNVNETTSYLVGFENIILFFCLRFFVFSCEGS